MKLVFHLFSAFLFTNLSLYAQDGVLDKNFANNGTIVFEQFKYSSSILSMVKLGDRIYTAGYTQPNSVDLFSILSFSANGELDTLFGDKGVVVPIVSKDYGVAKKILLQKDNKIIALGWIKEGDKDIYVLARINPDGSLDSSFGVGGVSKGSISLSPDAKDHIYDAGILSDGRIIITGGSYNGENYDVFIGCIDEKGEPCMNFGNNGFHILTFNDGKTENEAAYALTIDNDDNIYIGGSFKVNNSENTSLFVKKLNQLGEFDNEFGIDGQITLDSLSAWISVMKINAEEKLVLAGTGDYSNTSNPDFFLARYSLNGQIDSDFGQEGIVMLDRGNHEYILDIEILANEKIIAGGTGGFPSEFLLTRLNYDGTQDLTFGIDGWASTKLLSRYNGIGDIHVNENGSILAGGHVTDDYNWKMAFAQYSNTITSANVPVIVANNIAVFPNPASSLSTLTFSTDQPVRFSLRMTDMDGRNLSFRPAERNLQSGDHSFEIPLKEITVGNYLLILNFDGVEVARQIAVISNKK